MLPASTDACSSGIARVLVDVLAQAGGELSHPCPTYQARRLLRR